MTPTQIAIAAAAALFLVYLLVQVRPLRPKGTPATNGKIAEAKKRARTAKSPEARAAALADAGEAAVRGGHVRAAAGLFLRALRADPRSVEVVRRVSAALASRPALLEGLLLRRVAMSSASPDDEDPALAEAVEALAKVWKTRRSRGLMRMAERLAARERRAAEK
jgi:hypothetical protein